MIHVLGTTAPCRSWPQAFCLGSRLRLRYPESAAVLRDWVQQGSYRTIAAGRNRALLLRPIQRHRCGRASAETPCKIISPANLRSARLSDSGSCSKAIRVFTRATLERFLRGRSEPSRHCSSRVAEYNLSKGQRDPRNDADATD